jgi:hypothetical protein
VAGAFDGESQITADWSGLVEVIGEVARVIHSRSTGTLDLLLHLKAKFNGQAVMKIVLNL